MSKIEREIESFVRRLQQSRPCRFCFVQTILGDGQPICFACARRHLTKRVLWVSGFPRSLKLISRKETD